MTYREPPPGWHTFGTHVDDDVRLVFSDELGDDGLPLWERPADDDAYAGRSDGGDAGPQNLDPVEADRLARRFAP